MTGIRTLDSHRCYFLTDGEITENLFFPLPSPLASAASAAVAHSEHSAGYGAQCYAKSCDGNWHTAGSSFILALKNHPPGQKGRLNWERAAAARHTTAVSSESDPFPLLGCSPRPQEGR